MTSPTPKTTSTKSYLKRQMEDFSKAYTLAVASVAGYWVNFPSRDESSEDITIRTFGKRKGPRLAVQLKTMYKNVGHYFDGKTHLPTAKKSTLAYPLNVDNYHDLISTDDIPIILVVVVVPRNPIDWVNQSDAKLEQRYCGYWHCLMGQPPIPNKDNKTIHIPRTQVFNSIVLQDMMDKLEKKLPLC